MLDVFKVALRMLVVAACASTTLAAPSTTKCKKLSGSIPAPSVAPGHKVSLVASNLSSPRSILFDKMGNMLVLLQTVGVQGLKLDDQGGTCVTVANSKQVISRSDLNHGLALSLDGKTLYASSQEAVFSWSYDAASMTVSNGPVTLITNMSNSDHNTRTILVSKKKPGTIVVNRGSSENIDESAADFSSAHSQVKAFDLMKRGSQPYNFAYDGKVLGWGLRNDVGVGEEPTKGGIFSVENSADQISRYGQDFHQDNPGEELNYLGTLVNNKSPNQGSFFGYPRCFSAWRAQDVPFYNGTLRTGMPFALDPGSQYTDAWCLDHSTPATLTFQAHMAPLDIKFKPDGSEAWVTFHGSWDRTDPVGYKVTKIMFNNGQPVKPSTSKRAVINIVRNGNPSSCPNDCFRPVGLALSKDGRVFFSSDATGEIYVIQN